MNDIEDDEKNELDRAEFATIQAWGLYDVAREEMARITLEHAKKVLQLQENHRQKDEELSRIVNAIRERRGLSVLKRK